MNVDHERSDLVELVDGDRGSVDAARAPAAGRYLPTENDRSVFDVDAKILDQRQYLCVRPCTDVKNGLNLRARGPGPHNVGPNSVPENRSERVDHDRFAR